MNADHIDALAYKAFHAAHEAYSINKLKAILLRAQGAALDEAMLTPRKKAIAVLRYTAETEARRQVDGLPS